MGEVKEEKEDEGEKEENSTAEEEGEEIQWRCFEIRRRGMRQRNERRICEGEIGRYETSQDGRIHFPGFPHSVLRTECLPRRKPALYRQTEHTHTTTRVRLHLPQTFPKPLPTSLPLPTLRLFIQHRLLTPWLFDDPGDPRRLVNFKIVVTVVLVAVVDLPRDTHADASPYFRSECLQYYVALLYRETSNPRDVWGIQASWESK